MYLRNIESLRLNETNISSQTNSKNNYGKKMNDFLDSKKNTTRNNIIDTSEEINI